MDELLLPHKENEVLILATTWTNLENMIPREERHPPKTPHYRTPFSDTTRRGKWSQRQLEVLQSQGRDEWKVTASGCKVARQGDENGPKLD